MAVPALELTSQLRRTPKFRFTYTRRLESTRKSNSAQDQINTKLYWNIKWAFVRVRVARKQLGEIPDRTPRASRALGTGNEAPGHGLASQLTVEPQLDVARHKRRTGR